MKSEVILQNYWDIFLAHTCEFYPLEKNLIEKYEYELDWNSLSKNTLLNWDVDFLKRFESRFNWDELAWNESIIWTEEKINQFKKRLDWYYLGRNKNLPINEKFIEKYSKKLFVTENNPNLTPELIKQYNLKVIPPKQISTPEIGEISTETAESIFNSHKFYQNDVKLYQIIFFPIINKIGIETIFLEKFDYSQRYYFLEPIKYDIHGLTPEFVIDGTNPFEKFIEGRGIINLPKQLTLINGSLQEGPPRLYEVPRFSSFSFFSTILVSENVKAILEKFKLPSHKYHPVELRPTKITTSSRFYILQVDFDTLNKDLEYENRIFYYAYHDFKKRGHGISNLRITNHEELLSAGKTLNQTYSPVGNSVQIRPDRYFLKTDYDLYAYSVHGNLIINQFVKDALEKTLPGQIQFISAQLLNIHIDQEKYNAKSRADSEDQSLSQLTINNSEEDKFYFEKADRLEQTDPLIDAKLLENDQFKEKEQELNVLIPKAFKENYLNKKIRIKGYKLLPISRFYIQNEYAARYPETYKSLVIAENGVGDTINLILRRESDYHLGNQLYEFLHETGEYTEVFH